VAALSVALAAAVGLVGTSAAAAPTPTPLPSPTTSAPHVPAQPTLSPAELAAQIAAAERLRDDLLGTSAAVGAATTRLERLARQANTLLQEYAAARDAERAARAAADRQVARFEQLALEAKETRRAVGQWAFDAYAGGGSLAEMSAMLDALSSPEAEAIDPLAHLAYLSAQRVHGLEHAQDQAAEQQAAAVGAIDARTAAAAASRKATEARRALDAVIATQKRELETMRSLYAEQVSEVGPLSGLLLGSEDADAIEVTRELRRALKIPELFADPGGKACSGDEAEYPNGAIPARALCPLTDAPGESLRPAAAAAFNAMSKAHEKDTGSPLCVTDSYRSLPEQVAVKADKGKWAATPGTSEHGRGLALDLCGGVEDFGSPAHLWMRQNAPLYGWFHPSWAQSDGVLPEPWHWEYAG
jgi:hypothetical protein